MNINVPVNKNELLKKVLDRANDSVELQTYLKCSNIMAVDRLKYNDHGPVHIAIVANIALKLLRNLNKAGIEMNLLKDHDDFCYEDVEVLVFLAAIMHDVGHIVSRENHHMHSIAVAFPLLREFLDGIYEGEKKYIMVSDCLHAIVAHDKRSEVNTVEGGILRIADALDMEEGRARIPFKGGHVSIHSVSAMAIKDVKIRYRKEKPISIEIIMNNSAGIFQIDDLLKNKIIGTGLEEYIDVIAKIEGDHEEKIIDEVKLFGAEVK